MRRERPKNLGAQGILVSIEDIMEITYEQFVERVVSSGIKLPNDVLQGLYDNLREQYAEQEPVTTEVEPSTDEVVESETKEVEPSTEVEQ